MSDVTETTAEGTAPPAEVTPDDMIQRGKGLKLDAIEDGSPAAAFVEEFKEIQARFKAAETALEDATAERAAAVFKAKNDHNIGFTALGELMGVTSSMALYTYERAQGKSAKQIREESQRSAEAKKRFLESDPNRKPVRKQSEAEKALRKQMREQLAAFLAQEKASGANDEIGDDETVASDDDDT